MCVCGSVSGRGVCVCWLWVIFTHSYMYILQTQKTRTSFKRSIFSNKTSNLSSFIMWASHTCFIYTPHTHTRKEHEQTNNRTNSRIKSNSNKGNAYHTHFFIAKLCCSRAMSSRVIMPITLLFLSTAFHSNQYCKQRKVTFSLQA